MKRQEAQQFVVQIKNAKIYKVAVVRAIIRIPLICKGEKNGQT